jgi:hypothetical protein
LIHCWFPKYGETEDDARPFGGALRSACESACRDFDARDGGFTDAGFTVKARDANDRVWTVHVETELVAEYHARPAPIVVESTFHFSQRVAELLPPTLEGWFWLWGDATGEHDGEPRVVEVWDHVDDGLQWSDPHGACCGNVADVSSAATWVPVEKPMGAP